MKHRLTSGVHRLNTTCLSFLESTILMSVFLWIPKFEFYCEKMRRTELKGSFCHSSLCGHGLEKVMWRQVNPFLWSLETNTGGRRHFSIGSVDRKAEGSQLAAMILFNMTSRIAWLWGRKESPDGRTMESIFPNCSLTCFPWPRGGLMPSWAVEVEKETKTSSKDQ